MSRLSCSLAFLPTPCPPPHATRETAPRGSDGALTHIEYRAYEAVVCGGIVGAARTAAAEGFDALAIGCFYDTALLDAREVSGDKVGRRHARAALEWVHQMNAVERDIGMADRLSGFYTVKWA